MGLGPRVLVVGPLPNAALIDDLRRWGFDALAIDEPNVALDRCARSPVDVVIAMMPMSGMATATFCRELRRRERIPVLVAGPREAWIEVINAGAEEHIFVPCDACELQGRLEGLVRRFYGPLTPLRLVRIGGLRLYLRDTVTMSDPELALSPAQTTLLGILAGQVEAIVTRTTLGHQLRIAHGPAAAVGLDDELDALQAKVTIAAGRQALRRVDDQGWRLTRSSLCRQQCLARPARGHSRGDRRP